MPTFTQRELEVIAESLYQMILDGFPETDDDPIVTAFEKVKEYKPK